MILAAGFEISAMQMFWMDRASSEVSNIVNLGVFISL